MAKFLILLVAISLITVIADLPECPAYTCEYLNENVCARVFNDTV
jgi:hypothetical protein